VADAAVDDLRGTPPTSTTTTTLNPQRPCGEDPDGMCGGVCERGECVRDSLTGTVCLCSGPCGRDSDGTCGGSCPLSPLEQCVSGQSGDCVCFLPCQALGGIGSCQGSCADPRAVCSFAPPPFPSCSCIIPCEASGAPPCNPPCGPGQGCVFNPGTSACECVP
jgi:hypothetical protein